MFCLGRGMRVEGCFLPLFHFFCYYFISAFETRSHSVTQVTLTRSNPPALASQALGFSATPICPFYASQQCMKDPAPPSSCQYSVLKVRSLFSPGSPLGGGRWLLFAGLNCASGRRLEATESVPPLGPSSSHPLLLCCDPLSP